MNCDQVFDILTRGPFPTGTACDSGVESHLAECDSCRQLAEALRPALELFQEAVDPDESRDLPGYWCALVADRKQPVVSYAQELELPRVAPRAWEQPALKERLSALNAWRMAAMLALGVTVGSLVSTRLNLDGGAVPPRDPAAAAAAAADESPDPHAAARSEWAVLPAACFGNRPASGPRYTLRQDRLLATADLSGMNCCSQCHNSNSDKVPSAATANVSQHCQVCHTDSAKR